MIQVVSFSYASDSDDVIAWLPPLYVSDIVLTLPLGLEWTGGCTLGRILSESTLTAVGTKDGKYITTNLAVAADSSVGEGPSIPPPSFVPKEGLRAKVRDGGPPSMSAAAPTGPINARPRAAQPMGQSAVDNRNSMASNTKEDPVSNDEHVASSGGGCARRRWRQQQMRGIQGARIAKDAFEVAERYATPATAIGVGTGMVDRRGGTSAARYTPRGGGSRAPRS